VTLQPLLWYINLLPCTGL